MGGWCVTKEDPGSSRAITEATSAMTTQSATDIREHLQLLETERALALETALAHDPAYMADLREEIVATRHAYVGSAVAEIASFRAALSGAQVG
jgi:septum formation topological specificity factor MinE